MKTIELKTGQLALVDDEDFDYLSQFSWYLNRGGYACRTSEAPKDKSRLMHRMITAPHHGLVVDHKNRQRLDNQRDNLRICDTSQNCSNGKMRTNNTSGFRGVYFSKKNHKWVAYIHHHRKMYYLGEFLSKYAARDAYNTAAIEMKGEFAQVN